jgi:hypothetical protein
MHLPRNLDLAERTRPGELTRYARAADESEGPQYRQRATPASAALPLNASQIRAAGYGETTNPLGIVALLDIVEPLCVRSGTLNAANLPVEPFRNEY